MYTINSVNGRYPKQAGFISVRALFWLVVVFAVLYGAYMFIPPYAGYYMLKTEVKGEAKTAHMYTDASIMRRITEKASAWSVHLDESNVEITRGREKIRIAVNYAVDLDFFNRYEHRLSYSIEVTEPLKETGRVLQ